MGRVGIKKQAKKEVVKKCSVEGCGDDVYCKRMCSTHYYRQRNTGSTEIENPKRANYCKDDRCIDCGIPWNGPGSMIKERCMKCHHRNKYGNVTRYIANIGDARIWKSGHVSVKTAGGWKGASVAIARALAVNKEITKVRYIDGDRSNATLLNIEPLISESCKCLHCGGDREILPSGTKLKCSCGALAFRGTGNGHAKLKNDQIVFIRKSIAHRKTRSNTLAKKFNVSVGCINSIASGRSWTHVGGPITHRKQMGVSAHNSVLNEQLVRTIRFMHENESSIAEISNAIGHNKSTVRSVVDRKSWRHVV